MVIWLHLLEGRAFRCTSREANGQRSANRQPGGGLASDGGRPGMPVSVPWSWRTPTSGSDASSIWV